MRFSNNGRENAIYSHRLIWKLGACRGIKQVGGETSIKKK